MPEGVLVPPVVAVDIVVAALEGTDEAVVGGAAKYGFIAAVEVVERFACAGKVGEVNEKLVERSFFFLQKETTVAVCPKPELAARSAEGRFKGSFCAFFRVCFFHLAIHDDTEADDIFLFVFTTLLEDNKVHFAPPFFATFVLTGHGEIPLYIS